MTFVELLFVAFRLLACLPHIDSIPTRYVTRVDVNCCLSSRKTEIRTDLAGFEACMKKCLDSDTLGGEGCRSFVHNHENNECTLSIDWLKTEFISSCDSSHCGEIRLDIFQVPPPFHKGTVRMTCPEGEFFTPTEEVQIDVQCQKSGLWDISRHYRCEKYDGCKVNEGSISNTVVRNVVKDGTETADGAVVKVSSGSATLVLSCQEGAFKDGKHDHETVVSTTCALDNSGNFAWDPPLNLIGGCVPACNLNDLRARYKLDSSVKFFGNVNPFVGEVINATCRAKKLSFDGTSPRNFTAYECSTGNTWTPSDPTRPTLSCKTVCFLNATNLTNTELEGKQGNEIFVEGESLLLKCRGDMEFVEIKVEDEVNLKCTRAGEWEPTLKMGCEEPRGNRHMVLTRTLRDAERLMTMDIGPVEAQFRLMDMVGRALQDTFPRRFEYTEEERKEIHRNFLENFDFSLPEDPRDIIYLEEMSYEEQVQTAVRHYTYDAERRLANRVEEMLDILFFKMTDRMSFEEMHESGTPRSDL